jgi:hypothetical protein
MKDERATRKGTATVVNSVNPRSLLAVTLLLVVGVMALPSAASADLPKKPACAAVTATQLKSTFKFSFSSHWTSKEHHTTTLQQLACNYRSAEGDLSIDYYRYSSDKAARAHFSSVRKALIRQGNNGSPDSIVQLLPLIKLRGIGTMALRSTDGTVVEFVNGVDSVTIENGFADLTSRTVREMVAFARYVDLHG